MNIILRHSLLKVIASTALALTWVSSVTHADRPVHLQPSENAPVIARLAAGESPVFTDARPPLTSAQREAGWRAVSIMRNFSGYAHRSDVTKDLSLRPGAGIYVSRERDESQLLTKVERNDVVEVTVISGQWATVSIRKPVVGFIREPVGEETPEPPPAVVAMEEPLFIEPEEIPVQTPPPPAPETEAPRRRPAPAPGPATSGTELREDTTLRIFEGVLASSRSFLRAPSPYPYQLLDRSGRRIAYLDLNRMLMTVPMEEAIGTNFLVFGKAEPIPNRRDFVIRVEHMRTN